MAVMFKPLPTGGAGTSTPTMTARSNVASVAEDTALTGNVLTDDETTEGVLSVLRFDVGAAEYMPGASASLAGRGTISIASTGAYTFTPAPNVNGACPAVTYWVTNGHEIRVATLTITVTPVNDAPLAGSAYGLSISGEAVTLDLLASSTDPEDDAITVTLIDGLAPAAEISRTVDGASYVYHADGTITVTPDSADPAEITIGFRVSDGALTDDGTITVRVGVDNLPLFSPIAPLVSGVAADDVARDFATTFFQELHPDWPNVGPGGTEVTLYTSSQGRYDLTASREPWLYDRATTAWLYWKRTGLTWARDVALAWAEQYMAAVVVTGDVASFTIDGAAQDTKYIYPTIAWWYERETGNTVYRDKAAAMYRGLLAYWPTTYVVGPSLWTERGVAFAILGCLAQYAITGDSAALDSATDYVDGVIAMSTSGAPLHGHDQHEGDSLTTPITSPWMGAFLAESMVQYYRLTEDARIPTWLSNYGDWLIDHATYTVESADEPEFAGLVGLRLFAYLAGAVGPTDFGQADDIQHARDLRELFRKVRWAKQLMSLSTTEVDAVLAEQELVAQVDEAYWTRATVGYPRHRNNPSRKYAWKHRNDYSGGVYHVGLVALPPILLDDVAISGSTQQGSTLTATPGTWGGSPAPTLTYQWRRDGVAILGATGTTYVTQPDDIDATVTVAETATNDAGTLTSISNGIDVVLVGTPEVTTQPSGASAEVGQTASFTAACSATPTATYQWQRSPDGSSWTNVSGGSGGSGTGNSTTYTTPTLGSGDNGYRYRCQFTNLGGTVATSSALLSMVVAQASVRFAGDAGGAYLAYALGGAGHTDFTIEALVYLEQRNALASIWELPGVASRVTFLQHDNTFGVYEPTIGNSNNGYAGGGWGANPPPLNTWLYVTMRGPASAGGNVVATWTAAEGASGTTYTAQRASAIEGSVGTLSFALNGSGSATNGCSGNGLNVRYQFVRGRTGRLTDEQTAADRHSTDVTGWAFWWAFVDDGSGGVAVTDETGNGRTPTLANPILSTGPVVPSMP